MWRVEDAGLFAVRMKLRLGGGEIADCGYLKSIRFRDLVS